MAKRASIEIVGKIYPMTFSIVASKAIARKYGTVENALELFRNVNGTSETVLDDVINILEILIAQGCAYKNVFEEDVPPPKNAPIIDGKWTPLPREALEIAIGIDDLDRIADAITRCVSDDKQREISEKEKPGKNDQTAQE